MLDHCVLKKKRISIITSEFCYSRNHKTQVIKASLPLAACLSCPVLALTICTSWTTILFYYLEKPVCTHSLSHLHQPALWLAQLLERCEPSNNPDENIMINHCTCPIYIALHPTFCVWCIYSTYLLCVVYRVYAVYEKYIYFVIVTLRMSWTTIWLRSFKAHTVAYRMEAWKS